MSSSQKRHLTDLMFADDSAVFADAEATNILYNIACIAQSYGLKINADKTMDGSPANVYLEGIQIKQVEKFKYLGSLLQEKKVASTAEVYSRIGLATAACASNGAFGKSTILPSRPKSASSRH